MSSIFDIEKHQTNDTLQIKTNAKMGTGAKGSLLVDNGTDVIQQAAGTNAYIVTLDSTTSTGIAYKQYSVVSSNIIVPVVGGITCSGTNLRYSQFNVNTAMNSPSSIDYYNVPYDCSIESIELFVIPNPTGFNWPITIFASSYIRFQMGYESGGTFTPFLPNAVHFTIGGATAPIVGVPNINRGPFSGIQFRPVRFTPASASYTWNVTAGTNITLACQPASNMNGANDFVMMSIIRIKGSF